MTNLEKLAEAGASALLDKLALRTMRQFPTCPSNDQIECRIDDLYRCRQCWEEWLDAEANDGGKTNE